MREDLIRTVDLACGYAGKIVIDRVNLSFPKSAITCVLGRSGGGKSTLLRTLLLLEPPIRGDVLMEGKSMVGLESSGRARLRERFGVLFQGAALFSDLTLVENVAFPLYERRRLSQKDAEDVAHLKLGLVGLSDAAGRLPSQVSGGMRKRCGIARALALDPDVLFLDEPGAGLDPLLSAELDHLLLDLRDGLGSTFIIITHEIDSMRRIADQVVLLGDGEVTLAAPKDEVLASKDPYVRAFVTGAVESRESAPARFEILP